jgi:hypothetical protein
MRENPLGVHGDYDDYIVVKGTVHVSGTIIGKPFKMTSTAICF